MITINRAKFLEEKIFNMCQKEGLLYYPNNDSMVDFDKARNKLRSGESLSVQQQMFLLGKCAGLEAALANSVRILV